MYVLLYISNQGLSTAMAQTPKKTVDLAPFSAPFLFARRTETILFAASIALSACGGGTTAPVASDFFVTAQPTPRDIGAVVH